MGIFHVRRTPGDSISFRRSPLALDLAVNTERLIADGHAGEMIDLEIFALAAGHSSQPRFHLDFRCALRAAVGRLRETCHAR